MVLCVNNKGHLSSQIDLDVYSTNNFVVPLLFSITSVGNFAWMALNGYNSYYNTQSETMRWFKINKLIELFEIFVVFVLFTISFRKEI